jgi:hypothetical protein
MVKSPLFSCPFSIAPALFTVNHFSRNPLENNPADVFRESDRVSLGPFAHTLRRLFGQRVAVVALLKLAEAAGYEVVMEAQLLTIATSLDLTSGVNHVFSESWRIQSRRFSPIRKSETGIQ